MQLNKIAGDVFRVGHINIHSLRGNLTQWKPILKCPLIYLLSWVSLEHGGLKMGSSNSDLINVISLVNTGFLEEAWWNYVYKIS